MHHLDDVVSMPVPVISVRPVVLPALNPGFAEMTTPALVVAGDKDQSALTVESPERVALIQRLTWPFLRSALYPADTSWSAASAELTAGTDPLGRIESK